MTKKETEKQAAHAAHDVVQYLSLWLGLHDPDFQKQVAGKNLEQLLGMANTRYGADFKPGMVKASEILYWMPVYIQRFKESQAISKRRQAFLQKKMPAKPVETEKQINKKKPVVKKKKNEKQK